LVIVVTLIARATKKKQPAETEQRKDPIPDREPRTFRREENHPMTFEELLQEIQGSKVPKPQPVVQEELVDRAKEERQVLEDTDYDYRKHDQIYDIYENAKKEAFLRPSLEETLKLEDTIVRFNPFKGYQKEEPRNFAAELANEIRNPSGFRKAFIMSEILQRRF